MQVTDRLSPDAPSLTQAIIVQMVYYLCYAAENWLNLLQNPGEAGQIKWKKKKFTTIFLLVQQETWSKFR